MADEFEIQRASPDSPAPVAHHNAKYPFADMLVGDSFVSHGPRDTRLAQAARAFCVRHLARTGEGWRFRTRTEGNTTRCWRVE